MMPSMACPPSVRGYAIVDPGDEDAGKISDGERVERANKASRERDGVANEILTQQAQMGAYDRTSLDDEKIRRQENAEAEEDPKDEAKDVPAQTQNCVRQGVVVLIGNHGISSR
jgi:hypothetical protein